MYPVHDLTGRAGPGYGSTQMGEAETPMHLERQVHPQRTDGLPSATSVSPGTSPTMIRSAWAGHIHHAGAVLQRAVAAASERGLGIHA
jgi:hypothetical protein